MLLKKRRFFSDKRNFRIKQEYTFLLSPISIIILVVKDQTKVPPLKSNDDHDTIVIFHLSHKQVSSCT
jgi:hypothetical protein